ncbi:GntR family transcriptional regulator [Variovorax ginsengisoli]|jgi:DNA-binding GntR family transcriptional regulator|uniref:GntR family transcriptional regulator n=1 Tax=Variovorax ginsengisoli TaxID=363844 RepID=A0ABT8S5P1_9BURK|nr:GntR family transcriptional regulator [Variovorax ginsengisoli]MDN8615069.1 GntR family transcriptional regulator [Variovorax ginsengisoli]MDO1534239.1 GntR family transcriptional regulator [Variovorax ginsengisoli]
MNTSAIVRTAAVKSATAGANEGEHVNQRSRAYQGFRQQIIDARIRPGQFVSQRELMELLEMPLAAVRELIPRLEAAGLIKTVPQRGLQIASVDMKLIRNAWQVRAMVEREAVVNFARVASPETIARLIKQHEAILERAMQPHPDEHLEKDAQAVDWGLHDQMVDAIGNEILSEIYRVNSLHVRLIRYDADSMRPVQVVPAMREHLAFLHALEAGDSEGALAQMMAHIEQSKHRVLAGMLRAGQGAA